jgi:hypothetical protein
VPFGYRGVLLSNLLHDIVQVLHNSLNVLVQIANKMELQKIRLINDQPTRRNYNNIKIMT